MTSPARHDALLLAAASGDDEALARLVQTYHHRVHRFGLRACRDRFDADDAVQEAFSRLALRADVQRDPGVLSWLFTTVRNACLRLLRPFAREQRLGERADLDETPAPSSPPTRCSRAGAWSARSTRPSHGCQRPSERSSCSAISRASRATRSRGASACQRPP